MAPNVRCTAGGSVVFGSLSGYQTGDLRTKEDPKTAGNERRTLFHNRLGHPDDVTMPPRLELRPLDQAVERTERRARRNKVVNRSLSVANDCPTTGVRQVRAKEHRHPLFRVSLRLLPRRRVERGLDPVPYVTERPA